MQSVIRKDKETLENLVRRFNRKVIQSGTMTLARKKQYHSKPLSKRDQREIAIRKRARRDYKVKEQMYRGF